MTIFELGALGEFVGSIAVVGTFIYLAIQIRANTHAVHSAAAQSVHENFATWYNLLAGDSELSQILVKGLRDYDSLTEVEKPQHVSAFMAFLQYQQNAFIKWREGSLSPELWTTWELLMMNLVSFPGGVSFWRERDYLFTDDSRAHVENVMKRKPHPKAKPLGVFSIEDIS